MRLDFTSSDATTAAAVTIYNSNGEVRPLASWERLTIRTLRGYAASGAGKVTVFSDDDGGSDADAGERALTYEQTGIMDFGPEGWPIKPGKKLFVIAASSGAVAVSGTGDIEEGKTQGTVPNWQAVGCPHSLQQLPRP